MKWLIVLPVLLISTFGGLSMAHAQSAAAAIKEAQRTGRPIFAVAGATSCPHCVALMKRLNTEERLQPLIAQYVPLKLDVSSRDFQVWEKFFPRERSAIPALYIVTPKGEQLYGKLGSLPTERLEEMMLETLGKAGRFPTPEQWRDLDQRAREAEALLDKGELLAAAELVGPYFQQLALYGPLVEYHETGRYVVTLAEKFRTALGEFSESLSEDGGPDVLFEQALTLIQAQSIFADWPALADELTRAERRWARTTEIRQMLRRARELDQAVTLLATEDPKQVTKAVRQLNRIVARYPPTDQVAVRAAAALEKNEAGQEQPTR